MIPKPLEIKAALDELINSKEWRENVTESTENIVLKCVKFAFDCEDENSKEMLEYSEMLQTNDYKGLDYFVSMIGAIWMGIQDDKE